ELDAALVAAEAAAWRGLGVRRVVLSGGEPLMHSDLWSLVRPLVAEGIGITLLTTGLLLEAAAERVADLIDDVVVSLDGPAPIHDRVRRVPGAFLRLGRGVAAVRAEAARAPGPGPRITCRCTVQRANFRHLPETVAAALSLELDGVSFLAVDSTSEAFNRPGGWPEARRGAVNPAPEEIPAVRAEVERLIGERHHDLESGFVAESPSKLRRLADYFAAASGLGDYPPVACNAPWVSAVVESDGTVRPCFFHRGLGTWRPASLAAVVNGAHAVAFRRQLDVASNPTCARCVCSLNLDTDGLY
ncbi:MAG: radical SAM protein, partial [Anaerolineae bacterium]